MDETTDGAGSGSTSPDRDGEVRWREGFDAMLDAMPTVDRLGERLARLQRRYRVSVESDEPQGDAMKEIGAGLEGVREEVERLPIHVPPPAP